MPLSTLQETPRDVPSKTQGQDGFATSFPVGLLHPLQHAGLSRRSPVSPSLGSKSSFGISLGLSFPPESAVFKVECNLPELRTPNAQNTVKIVSVIFPVICDKHDLLADCLFA